MQNDMLEWILEQAIPRSSNDDSIVSRILLVNFAATAGTYVVDANERARLTGGGRRGASRSPATVADRLDQVYRDVGGFGSLLVFGFDYSENPDAWHNSLRLLAQEVAPRIKHLTPA